MSRLEELIQELCPNGVEYKKLGDIGQVKMCKRILKSQTNTIGGIPFYKIGTFGGEANSFISKGLYEEYKEKYSYPKIGEILISAAGTIGRTVVYDGEPAYYQDSNIVWLSHNESDVLNTFLRYCYELKPWSISSGGTIPRLYNDNILKDKIPVPPLEVQREIVRVLDSFTLLTAELTAELTARKKQYEYYRDKLLFSEESNVKSVPLGDIAKFVYGYTDKAKDIGSARFVRITDITEDGRLDPYNAKYIELTTESSKYLLQKGDLLLARTGATYGKTLYFDADEPAVYASFLIKIILDNSIIKNRYYWHFSKSSLYWEQAERYVSKGGQQQFNTNAVSRVKVPIPSLEVQDRIIKILDRFDALCNDISIGLPAEIEARQKQYEFYRDKLLSFKQL